MAVLRTERFELTLNDHFELLDIVIVLRRSNVHRMNDTNGALLVENENVQNSSFQQKLPSPLFEYSRKYFKNVCARFQ